MNSKKVNKSNPSEPPQESKLVEYHDYFISQKNKKVNSKNLGEKTAALNIYFFEYFKEYNIPSAYLKKVNNKSITLLKVEEFPFHIRIINTADARTSKIFSIKAGSSLQLPIMEYHYGDSKDSIINESHIISFNLGSYDELKLINRICSKLNAIVKSFFERRNASLLELTCRFGKFEGKVLLIDNFSPLSVKVSSIKTDDKLPDPYKIETAAQMNKYSDYLLKLIKGE
jgi:phosphoribosylaminoimidazole-succinocarboxamide synthase